MDFSKKLREMRARKGVSQAKLADEIHISRSAVAKWENGLGLPADESLKLLAEYFEVDEAELLHDKSAQQDIVSRNRTIEAQSRIIIGFVCGIGAMLLVLGYFLSESLRDALPLIAFGVIITLLGTFNLKGNIASIHWYNRRKVTKENQLSYCRLVGAGSIVIGVSMLLSAMVQILFTAIIGMAPAMLISGAISIFGIIIGLVLILIAQFKYNKGLF